MDLLQRKIRWRRTWLLSKGIEEKQLGKNRCGRASLLVGTLEGYTIVALCLRRERRMRPDFGKNRRRCAHPHRDMRPRSHGSREVGTLLIPGE